jgi:hypothetical protein
MIATPSQWRFEHIGHPGLLNVRHRIAAALDRSARDHRTPARIHPEWYPRLAKPRDLSLKFALALATAANAGELGDVFLVEKRVAHCFTRTLSNYVTFIIVGENFYAI